MYHRWEVSYNPDELVVDDHAFQPIQGRFCTPHILTNAPYTAAAAAAIIIR